MPELHGLPYFEVQFTKDGAIFKDAEAEALRRFVADQAPTDLIVISHGWNNDLEDARDLYDRLLRSVRTQLDAGDVALDDRRFAILAVLWPSKKFTDEDLIAGGAASLGGVSTADLRREIERLATPSDIGGDVVDPAVRQRLDDAEALVSRLEGSPSARREFVDALRALLPTGDEEIDAEIPSELLSLDGDELLARLGTPPPLAPPTGGAGGAAVFGNADRGGGIPDDPGGPAFLSNLFGGVKAGARLLLNLTTYYTMKDRSWRVGAGGASRLIGELVGSEGPRLHLVGHSFGARLVSTVATVGRVKADSMVLLQAAFSHHGFAPLSGGRPQGIFRRAVAVPKVSGPIFVTHTANDRAVGLAYPIASRIASQRAQSLGGPDDIYGGLGRNGARDTPEAIFGTLQPVGVPYRRVAGRRIHNLLADDFVSGHSDIKGREVAHVMLSAIALA